MRHAAFGLILLGWATACGSTAATIDPGTGGAAGSADGGNGGGGGTVDDNCRLGELGACGDGQKCTVVDITAGDTGCITAGDAGRWSRCTADDDCQELTYCDARTGVCKPLCDSEDDCAGDGRCVPAVVSLGEPIGGLSLCTAGCHPLTGAPCDLMSTACVAHNPGDDIPSFDCASSDGAPLDALCTPSTSSNTRTACGQGLACATVQGGDAMCKRWCSEPGAQAECDAGTTCADAGISHMSVAYGLCP